MHSKRTYIQKRIDEILDLKLIERKGSREAKNHTSTSLYAFTTKGRIFAWILEVQRTTEDLILRRLAVQMLFMEVCEYIRGLNSLFADFFTQYFERYFNEDDSSFQNYNPESFFELFPITPKEFPSFRLYLFMFALLGSKISHKVFLELINKLDEETRKLILFQLKLDIETSHYNGGITTKDWEKKRYENINDYNKIVLQGYCVECKSSYPSHVGTLNLFQTKNEYPSIREYTRRSLLYRVRRRSTCPTCKTLGYEFIIPSFYYDPNRDVTKPKITIETSKKAFDKDRSLVVNKQ